MKVEKLRDLDEIALQCPRCDGVLRPTGVQLAGMPILVSACCSGCRRTFEFDWPAGHALLHPVIVEKETGAVYVGGAEWYARHFLSCLATRTNKTAAQLRVRGSCRKGSNATLLNCVDYLYGHVLLKLMSVAKHMREAPDDDVVVVVPKLLSWLVPEEAITVEVDVALSSGDHWIAGLDAFVENVLEPCSTVRIAPAVSQPEVAAEDLEFLGLRPQQAGGPLQVGLILRSDRLWLGPPSLSLRVTRRLPPRRAEKARLLAHQDRNYVSLARCIRERHPEARVVALGLGQPEGLAAEIEDLRAPGPISTTQEWEWVKEYARCRVIVGVHGSAMLLPSLLAGAVVELVPTYKLGGAFLTDILIPARSIEHPKLALFRYRMLPVEARPETVAANVLSIIRTADFQRQNVIENARAYESPAWPQPFDWRPTALSASSEGQPVEMRSRPS